MSKREKLLKTLKENQIDAILVSNFSNIFYYSNFKGTNAKLLICEEAQYLITDFRYQQQAAIMSPDFTIICTDDKNDLNAVINKLRKKHKFSSLALEGDYVVRNEWLNYERNLTPRLVDLNIDFIRESKYPEEIDLIKKAISIAEHAYLDMLDYIQVGMSELHVARYLENKMLDLGADAVSFQMIVASGERSSLPHGVASDKIIENNELVTFDFGCYYKGYCSDITRTIGFGEIDPQLVDVYNTVLEANLLGIKSIKANMDGSEVDKIVRDYIYAAGYEGKFGHGLGHSIGIDIHENPRLRSDVDHKLAVGNIVTIEPGIYLEDLGGVRIEDDVLILEDRVEVLTTLDKQLIIL